jgi:hypothetical protein
MAPYMNHTAVTAWTQKSMLKNMHNKYIDAEAESRIIYPFIRRPVFKASKTVFYKTEIRKISPLKPASRDKFAEIYSDYYQIVYGVIYSKIGNLDDTDDLTQEVFMHFYGRMDEVQNIRAWLLGTVRNVLLNIYRKK